MSEFFKLNDRVSANNDVEPEDAKKLKRAMMRLDFLEAPELGVNGFVDTPLLDAVKSFQGERGLRPDGIVKPGGPTEAAISLELKETETRSKQSHRKGSDGGKSRKPSGSSFPNTPPDSNTPITAQPSGIFVFKFDGRVPPSSDDMRAASGGVENNVLPNDPGRKVEAIEPPIAQEREGQQPENDWDDCLLRCLAEQFGVTTIVGGTAVAAGQGVMPKRFVMEGSSKRHSIASKYLPKAIPKRFKYLPSKVWTPTFKNPRTISKLTGAVIARWIPWVGWGLLANDAVQIGRCVHRCRNTR